MDTEDLFAWTVAAFVSNPEAPDDGIAQLLTAAGIPAGPAERAVAFLPLAFGRVLLADLGPRFADEYVEVDATRRVRARLKLSDDPLFAASLRSAKGADRAQMQAIALRSAEVNALNQALHAGSKAEDLVFTPPLITLRATAQDTGTPWWRAWLRPDSAPSANTVLPGASLRSAIEELLSGHGLKVSRRFGASALEDGQTFEVRSFPRALHGESALLQLDVRVRAPLLGERAIVESFAGSGKTIDTAVHSAVDKFARGSLHVLLATLVRESLGGDQVEWETWSAPGGAWRVCMGPLLRLAPPMDGPHLSDWLDTLKGLIAETKLSREPHWVRTYYAARAGETVGNEVLLDNEPWPDAQRRLGAREWPVSEGFFGVRLFMMLVPAA
jgi:hypothetical protein